MLDTLKRNWKNILLVLSLALNIYALASFAYLGYQIRSFVGGDETRLEERIDRMQSRFVNRLEGSDRELAQRVFDARRPAILKSMREIRAARRDAALALRESTPDGDRLAAALERSQAAAANLNAAVHGGLQDMARELSPEARRKLGKRSRRYDRDRD